MKTIKRRPVSAAPYYVGLDVGTNSVGFAATDLDYNLLKYGNKYVWGMRLFEEGETAEERRKYRTARRRLARSKWRLSLLQQLFDAEISAKDPAFFLRMQESALVTEEKTSGTTYSLFADADFTDKQFHKKYPSFYHLRDELIKNPAAHDVRLVFLAIHHILKSRGHFLYEISGDDAQSLGGLWQSLLSTMRALLPYDVCVKDTDALFELLKNDTLGKTDKGKKIADLIEITSEEIAPKQRESARKKLGAFLAGGKVKLSDIFVGDYSDISLSLDMTEEALQEQEAAMSDDFAFISGAKALYDFAIVERLIGGYDYFSQYKVEQYKQHKSDITLLKSYVKYVLDTPQEQQARKGKNSDLYHSIFGKSKEKKPNYAAYVRYHKGDEAGSCTQEELCKFLLSVLPQVPVAVPAGVSAITDEQVALLYARMKDHTFAPKLRSGDNGVIPNGLHRKELVKILENARGYLPFLSERDEAGISTEEKILAIFDFRIPYYVGKLKGGWMVRRKDGQILPWNFEEMVDKESSAEGFMANLCSLCAYTGEPVLPKESLLYAEYEVLSELNNIRADGAPLAPEIKEAIFQELFVKQNNKVTKKRLETFLKNRFSLSEVTITGMASDAIQAKLTAYHKLLPYAHKLTRERQEEIIRRITIFGESKDLLRKWLRENTPLTADEVRLVARLRFTGWGRLSKKLLVGIQDIDTNTGELLFDPVTQEPKTVMYYLHHTEENLMQILSEKHGIGKRIAEERQRQTQGVKSAHSLIDSLYVSPKIKRSIWQTLRIVEEIVQNRGGAPKRIFIEVARDQDGKNDKTQKDSRKQHLLALYEACKKEKIAYYDSAMHDALKGEDAGRLRSDKLFLYYAQLGRCMYSGDPIDLERLLSENGGYDIDHIFPRSRVKDDSLDNRVLVKKELNKKKDNNYPIPADWKTDSLIAFWRILRAKDLISPKKFDRLMRTTPLTEKELTDFVARQLVETRQSTKALAELLDALYPDTKIVYSKAGNITDFRKWFEIPKSRDVSDCHHAHDAYLNIVVGNFFHTKFTQEFFRNILFEEEYSLNERALYSRAVKGAWTPGEDGTIAIVRHTLSIRQMLYTRPVMDVSGQLYDLQIVKAGNGQIPVKAGKDIGKYGGYNKATGCYFALVEREVKGKRVRSLEVVLLMDKVVYERDPQAYAEVHWEGAHIINPHVPVNSLIEINGIRYHITGRTGDYIVLAHAHQLYLNEVQTIQIRHIAKYISRCKEAHQGLPYPKDEISPESNLALYDLFIAKLQDSLYGRCLAYSNLLRDVLNNRTKFMELDIQAQCETILEILHSFQCNVVRTSLKALCGKGTVGVILANKALSNYDSALLIHQSPTGLYEVCEDLLAGL